MPYAIINLDTGAVVRRFGSLPRSFEVAIDGHFRRIISPVAVGDEGLGYRFVQVIEVGFTRPGPYFTQEPDTEVFDDATTLTITRSWTAWTQGEIDAYEASRKDGIASEFDDVDAVVRAAVLVIMDEFNLHADRLNAIFAAAAGASNLAGFKTAMASIPTIQQRTAAQLKTAIREKVGS